MLLDIAKIEQGVIIDLYDIDLSEIVGNKTVLRFHNGLNELRRPITWQGNVYEPYPIKAQGFEKNGQGTSNRPTLTSSNVQDILNGLIESKAASPILRLFASDDVNPDDGFIKAGFAHVNDEAKNAYAKKIAVGHYEIHGSLGIAKDGWYITLPEDANGNKNSLLTIQLMKIILLLLKPTLKNLIQIAVKLLQVIQLILLKGVGLMFVWTW